jgi:hypothetical protein
MQFLVDGGAAVFVALVIGIIKGRWSDLSDVLPLFAIVIGIILSIFIGLGMQVILTWADFTTYALTGLFIGLAAVGGYEATWDKLKSRPVS